VIIRKELSTIKILKEPWRILMALKATSVRLDDETLLRIGQMAEAMDRPRAWLMAEAIKQYVVNEEWFIREVEKGVQAANKGRLIDHADIKAKWRSKRADQVD
jgi:predicted transcriptional regulator